MHFLYVLCCMPFSNDKVKALITTGSTKFYSNGLDLEELSKIGNNSVKLLQFDEDMRSMFKKILTFPAVTIAALNGGQGEKEGK